MNTNDFKENLINNLESYLNGLHYYLDIGTGTASESVSDSDLDIPAGITRRSTQTKSIDESSQTLTTEFWIPSTIWNDLYTAGATTGGDSDAGFGDTNYEAQSFQLNKDANITQLKLYLKYNTGTNNDITVEIQTDNSGEPSGTTVTDGSATLSSFSDSSYAWKTIDFNEPSLDADTSYWIVVKSTGSDADAYHWQYASTGSYSDGSRSDSTDGGSNWTAHTGQDLLFKPYINKFSELGLFDDSTSGDLLSRNQFTEETKSNDIEYLITITESYSEDINH